MIKLTKKLIADRLMLARCQITTAGDTREAMSNKIKADRGGPGPHFVTNGQWAVDLGLIHPVQRDLILKAGTAGIADNLGIWDNEAGKAQPLKGKLAGLPRVSYMEAGAVAMVAAEQAKKGGREFKRTAWIKRAGRGGLEAYEYRAEDGERLYIDRRIVDGMDPFYIDSVFAHDSKSPAFVQGMPTTAEPWKFGIMIMPMRLQGLASEADDKDCRRLESALAKIVYARPGSEEREAAIKAAAELID